jgi:hypothetical protein
LANQDVGLLIRKVFRDLLGSRLNAHLEEELMRLRNDYESRLQERERVISDLREQVAQANSKIDRYEMVIIPMAHGGLFAPKRENPQNLVPMPPATNSWSEIQAEWKKKQEEEIAQESRAEVSLFGDK